MNTLEAVVATEVLAEPAIILKTNGFGVSGGLDLKLAGFPKRS